jgi:hypothetical protein
MGPILYEVGGLVPKKTQSAACTDIECAFCEMCFYNLGFESLDLLPPSKYMYICDVCNRTYHWQCLLKTNHYTANEREAIDTSNTWACPAELPNENEKKERTDGPLNLSKKSWLKSLKRELGKVSNIGARRTAKYSWKF